MTGECERCGLEAVLSYRAGEWCCERCIEDEDARLGLTHRAHVLPGQLVLGEAPAPERHPHYDEFPEEF